MKAFKRFSSKYPIWFGIAITCLVLLWYILAGIAAAIFADTAASSQVIEAIGRLIGAGFFVFLIWRFGWAKESGMTRSGALPAWGIAAIILVYEIATHVLPDIGNFQYANMQPNETLAVILNALATGPLEEIAFRGIVFCAFLQLWGHTEKGVMKSVILSAILFGASHLIHIFFGRPIPQALLVTLNAALASIYYAAIMLRWRSIWPLVAIHGLLNAAASVVAFYTPGYDESVLTLIISVLFQIPIAALGIYLIRKIKLQQAVLLTE